VVAQPDGPQAAACLEVAQLVVARLQPAGGGEQRKPFPQIVFDN
jgi:hypothetical protein